MITSFGLGVARGPAGGSSILVGVVSQEYELSQYNQDDSIRSCVQQKAIIRSVHLRIAHESFRVNGDTVCSCPDKRATWTAHVHVSTL